MLGITACPDVIYCPYFLIFAAGSTNLFMKNVKLIEVKSELGAGTRGASLGIEALKIACLDANSDYFKRFNSVEVPNDNYVLFNKNLFPFAKHIDSILVTLKSISSTVAQTFEF